MAGRSGEVDGLGLSLFLSFPFFGHNLAHLSTALLSSALDPGMNAADVGVCVHVCWVGRAVSLGSNSRTTARMRRDADEKHKEYDPKL